MRSDTAGAQPVLIHTPTVEAALVEPARENLAAVETLREIVRKRRDKTA